MRNTDFCEICVPCDMMIHLLPPSAVEFMQDNYIFIENPDFEGSGDYKVINLSEYPRVILEKSIVIDYLIKYDHISNKKELDHYLSSTYLDEDFRHLPEYMEENVSPSYREFYSSIINSAELYMEIMDTLKREFGYN